LWLPIDIWFPEAAIKGGNTMKHHQGLAYSQELGACQQESEQCAERYHSVSPLPRRPPSRRIALALSTIVALGILGAAYAAFIGLPGLVRIAPVSIVVHSSNTLPPEVQALEAQTAPNLFDRDTTNGYVAYADDSIDLALDQPREIHAIKVYGPAPYNLTVQALDGGAWTTISGLDNIKLANLASGWNTLQAAQLLTTSNVRLVLTLAGGNGGGNGGANGKGKGGASATTTGAIPEIEIWAAGKHSLVSGNNLVAAAVGATQTSGISQTQMPAQARVYTATPDTAVVGGSLQTFSITIDRPAARFKRAWLTYEAYGLANWVSPVRSINGQAVQGGAFTFSGDYWTPLAEPINPNWLVAGKNTVSFTLPPGLAGNYSVRNIRIVGELDDGNNFIARATTGNATSKTSSETDAPQLIDGDLTTGWTPWNNPHGGNPTLTLYFDKPTQLDSLNLDLVNSLSGTLNVDLLVGGQWQSAGLQTINGKKLSAGWNAIGGFAAVAAEALRITFQSGQGSAGEILDVTATGSGTGSAFVPAIDVAYPDAGQFYGRQAYIRGYLTVPDNGSGPATLTVANTQGTQTQAAADGSFGILVAKDDVGYANQTDTEPWQVTLIAQYPDSQKLTQTVKLTQAGSAADAHGLLPNMPNPGLLAAIASGDASIEIPPGALDKPLPIKITALGQKDLPALDPGMTNVTPYPNRGYRFTPHGTHFKKDVKVTIPFDPKLVPQGLTTADIKTYYFDTERGHWVELAKYRLDEKKNKLTSLTNHFTDMINATLVVPDHPETASYNATQMKDIKAADPGAGINLIEPPKPNNMGDARLSYPIEIPKGRQGMQPQLAISYSSGGGNGWLGLGWDLSTPQITVDTRWGAPRYSGSQETETYMLNGEMLTPVAHRGALQPRTAEKIFHTRVEGGFQKIIRHGDSPTNYWWEVVDKNGTHSYYGGISASDANGKLGGGFGIYRWALRQTVDTHGNTVNYTYAVDTNSGTPGGATGYQLYIDHIDYTGSGGKAGPYTITFKRSAGRPDIQIDARGRFKQVTAALLNEIDVSYSGNLVRSYKLNYQTGAFNKTLLASVVQYGKDGTTEFNRHTFAYYNDAQNPDGSYKGFAPSTPWNIQDDSVSTVSMFGNGSVSALGGTMGTSVGGSLYFGVGTCCDVVSKEISGGARIGYSSSQNDTLLVMADVNGDGLPDKVFKKGGTFYYRPNCSGAGSAAPAGCKQGTGAYFGDMVQIGLPALGHDSTTTTSAGGNVYFGVAVMAETSDSYTTSDTYVTDVNGDGIPDIVTGGQVIFGLVSNGVPAYSANSSDTPVPVGAGTLDTSNLLADPTQIEQQRAATFPLLDSVRRWVAPYDGVVTITGTVQLVQDTSAARAKYQTADGVRVAIQQNATELWNTTIGATDYKPKTPNNVANLTVKAGDAIYFRVQSVNDGMYDQVAWNPEITYQGVDTTQVDENNLTVYDYQGSKDFTLAGRATTLKAPLTGTLHLAGTLTKNAVTSDDITLVIYQNGNAVYSLPVTRDQTGSFPISQDIQVTQQDQLQWKILTDSRIDASQVQLLPQGWYTAAQGVDGVKDEQGNYVLQIHPSWTMDLYPASALTAPQGGYVVQKSDLNSDGTITIAANVGPVQLAPGATLPLAFTVKRNGLQLAKNILTLVEPMPTTANPSPDPVSASVTVKVPAQKGDVLFFSFAARDPNALTLVGKDCAVQVGPSQHTSAPSALYAAGGEGLFPQAFRNWDTFGYNGNSPRDTKAIDQSLLVWNNNTQASNVTAYLYVSDPVLNHWAGPDAATWISGSGAASSRIGLKSITMPRGAQFAGASAPPRMSHSHNDSATLGVGASTGSSESQVEFQDLNGDHFPDVISQGGVQYTAMTGGLSGTAGGGIGSARTNTTSAFNASTDAASQAITFASARGHTAAAGEHSSIPGGGVKTTQPSLGFGGSVGGGTSDTQSDLIDINGDGLPDKVFQDGTVWLNTGYEFVPDGNWGGGAINRGESVNTGVNYGFSMDNGSIEGGLNLAIAESHTNETYADINGDGLPDKITGSGTYSVMLNTGSGFAPAIAWPNGQDRIAVDKNLTLGAGATYTAGIPIVIAGIKIVITPNVNGSTTLGRPELEFRDMDGDGYPDQAYSLKDSQLSVAINQIGRTNLLKQVNRPLGATITLEYQRVGNTYAMPQSRWVMSKVSVNDGHPGDGVDVMQNAYQYQGGNYDRYEREFLGFKTVTSMQLNTDGSTYRKVIDTYFNGSVYDKGLQSQEQTYDGQGNIYTETLNTYALRDIANGAELPPDQLDGQSVSYAMNTFFPMLTKAEHHFYEGGQGDKYTWDSMVYDSVGNVVTYTDAGDLDIGGTAVTATITYSQCTASNVIGKPLSITVQDASGNTLRSRTGTVDCATGNITQISQWLNGQSAATTDLGYDGYGNLASVTGPANAKGQRFRLDYTYDGQVQSFITQVKDSYGHSSSAAYDDTSYEFGGPKSTTDLNNNVISYAYDVFGRTTGIQGPYEQGTQNLTLAFAYHPEAVVPYATTDHLNKDAKGTVLSPIKTVTFIDGLKRAIQVKKSSAIDQGNGTSTPMMIVSGHAVFDAMGRTIEQRYPVTEPLGQETTFNPAIDDVTATTTEYDVMDRMVQTTLPDGTITTMAYGFGNDRNGVNQFLTTVTDANGKQKQSYHDMRELITSVSEFNQGQTLWTSYAYDPLKEIIQVKDAKGNKTTIAYDNLGRRTSIDNPDTGLTTTVYDLASNLIQKITANLRASGSNGGNPKAINYTYDYLRLTNISYPDSKGNDVTYEYGAPGATQYNQAGRIVKVTDASGTAEMRYGKLGETVWDRKTIASGTQGKSANSPEVYTTQYQYDTFGRLMVLTLPDGEVLTHSYDAGGNLASITGVEGAQGANTSTGGMVTNYLQTLLYDKFEQRTYLKLGNGVETHYTYNAQNRRLMNLMSQGAVAGQFQNLNYGYDNVGNILSLANKVAVPPASSMGGPTSQTFGYDDLYRLTSAKGGYQYAPGKTRNYTLGMQYDDIHNIVGKTQTDAITEGGGKPITQKATTYNWSYIYSGSQPHAPTHIGNRAFSYDLNGNQTGWTNDNNGTRRVITWDEENRISQIDDNGERNTYTYDAAGERTIKVSRQGQTVYVNQYYVVRNRSIVSKHIFANNTRIATHMEMGNGNTGSFRGNGGGGGNGGSGGNGGGQGHADNGNAYAYGQDKQHGQSNEDRGQSGMDHGNSQVAQASHDNGNGNGGHGSQGNGHGSSGNGGSTDTTISSSGAEVSLPGNSDQGLENALANGQGHKYGIYKHLEREGDTVSNSEIVSSSVAGATTGANGQSSFLYYYHPDHLGSTGFVTDANGKLYEHMEYFPFGESWVDEHSNTLRTPYLFTGKEFDQETGLYYFGARYYDPRTSVWQSPDPILGSYLPTGDKETDARLPGMGGVLNTINLALYTYASHNPLRFTDPDGRASCDSPEGQGKADCEYDYTFDKWVQDVKNSWGGDLSAGLKDLAEKAVQSFPEGTAAKAGMGILTVKALKTVDKAASVLSPAVKVLAEANITKKGITVLGHYKDGYIEKAKKLGASYFDLGKMWEKLAPAEREAANMHFLDKIIAAGDKVRLATPKLKIQPGSQLEKEIKYLEDRGYQWINQWELRPTNKSMQIPE
jgi:RHS repeat-associated protein